MASEKVAATGVDVFEARPLAAGAGGGAGSTLSFPAGLGSTLACSVPSRFVAIEAGPAAAASVVSIASGVASTPACGVVSLVPSLTRAFGSVFLSIVGPVLEGGMSRVGPGPGNVLPLFTRFEAEEGGL